MISFTIFKGTLVLWVYWPSFNAAGDEGDSQHRNVMNTFLALIASGISCFLMSELLHKNNKFIMVRNIPYLNYSIHIKTYLKCSLE